MESYWNSSYADLNPKFNCAETSERDINTTVTASQVIVASYSMLFYLVLLLLSILGVRFQPCVKILNSQGTALFLIGAPIVFVNIFSNSNNLEVKIYFRLASGSLVGILFMAAGAMRFFTKSENQRNQSTLEHQQPSMGLVVKTITLFLIILEAFLLAAANAAAKKNDNSEESHAHQIWILVLSDKVTFLVQKIIQAFIYCHVLRPKTFSQDYKENAQFYFKVLAFFNLMEWVDSQVNEESDVHLSGAGQIYGEWFDIPITFYKALIIDYRLLCSLLFLEHSLEDGLAKNSRGSTARLITPEPQYQSAAVMIGFTSLSAPICCALYFVPKLSMPAWVHVFSIIVNLAIIGFGAIFLGKNNLESEEENTQGSSGVKIMVCGLYCYPFLLSWAPNGIFPVKFSRKENLQVFSFGKMSAKNFIATKNCRSKLRKRSTSLNFVKITTANKFMNDISFSKNANSLNFKPKHKAPDQANLYLIR